MIEEWTVHCPDCGRPVPVREGADAVACAHCHRAFAPEALKTAAYERAPEGPQPRDPNDELVGKTYGDWKLLRLIGRGGMGKVYEATDAEGTRRVAVKLLSTDLAADPSFVKRFRREARLLSDLSHPHVVEVFEQGEADGHLWFVMEYVRGENLRRRLERGPLPAGEAVQIAGEIASALAYAHGRGIVHRDLKPENVLLDADGHVHLADFGLSRLVRTGGHEATTLLTRTDVILGTYEYMAPEQRRGETDLDGRADIFALGVILYEMLTGNLPHGRFQPPSRVQLDTPATLDGVVNRALTPERDGRYASADAFRQALEAALVPPAPPTPPPPLPNQRRRRVPVILDDEALATLRPVLRHVDILSALDRVLGLLLLLGGIGLIPVAALTPVGTWIVPLGGIASIVLIVAGVLFMRQGKRLSRMSPESREGQLTASVILLFFPPFLTAMGIYSLLVLTGDRARRAFAVGRRPLEGPKPVVAQRVVSVETPPRKKTPWILLRVLFIASVLWTVYAVFVAIDTRTNLHTATFVDALEHLSPERQFALKVSLAGVLASLVAIVLAFRARRVRRGLGIAIVTFLLFLTDAAVLSRLHVVNRLALLPQAEAASLVYEATPSRSLKNRFGPRLEIPR